LMGVVACHVWRCFNVWDTIQYDTNVFATPNLGKRPVWSFRCHLEGIFGKSWLNLELLIFFVKNEGLRCSYPGVYCTRHPSGKVSLHIRDHTEFENSATSLFLQYVYTNQINCRIGTWSRGKGFWNGRVWWSRVSIRTIASHHFSGYSRVPSVVNSAPHTEKFEDMAAWTEYCIKVI